MSPRLVVEPNDALETVCFKVSTALTEAGIHAVLTGGSAATVYAPESYRSSDADFILGFATSLADTERVFAALGFSKDGRIYKAPGQLVTLDIPDNQIMIGSEHVRDFATLEREGLTLRILTPLDCVRDRLTHYFWWNDHSALTPAVAVAKAQSVDLGVLESWAKKIGEEGAFADFLRRFHRS